MDIFFRLGDVGATIRATVTRGASVIVYLLLSFALLIL